MSTEQQVKYQEILHKAQDEVTQALIELKKHAHDQKIAYRYARMFTYKLQQRLKDGKYGY